MSGCFYITIKQVENKYTKYMTCVVVVNIVDMLHSVHVTQTRALLSIYALARNNFKFLLQVCIRTIRKDNYYRG